MLFIHARHPLLDSKPDLRSAGDGILSLSLRLYSQRVVDNARCLRNLLFDLCCSQMAQIPGRGSISTPAASLCCKIVRRKKLLVNQKWRYVARNSVEVRGF